MSPLRRLTNTTAGKEQVMAEEEIWKPVPGFEGYEVSDLGRARSVDRIVSHRESAGSTKALRGRILKPQRNRGGFHVNPCVGGKQKQVSVHVLVMRAFCGNPPDPGLDVCHNDGDSSNNKLSNLRYDTRKGNLADRWRHGTMNVGQMNGTNKLTVDQVREIRMRMDGLKSIARDYGVSSGTVWAVRTRRAWAWVS